MTRRNLCQCMILAFFLGTAQVAATEQDTPLAPQQDVETLEAKEQTTIDQRLEALEKEMQKVKETREKSAAAPAPVPTDAPKVLAAPVIYDSVPGDQKDAVLKRIRLVETLVAKYGRAYDYRAYTIAQLEKALNRLESDAKLTPAAATTPATDR